MDIQKKIARIAAMSLCAAVAAVSLAGTPALSAKAASADAPYNITVGIGSKETEVRFNWLSTSNVTGKLQIAKTSDMAGGNFPDNSTSSAAISEVTAAEGVLDNSSTAADHPVSYYKAANGTDTLQNEYANKVTVSGLDSGTSYTYRVGDGTNWSQNYTFTTAASTDKGYNFVAVGDPQLGASGNLANDTANWAAALQTIGSKLPHTDFLFSLGDEVNDYDHLYTQQQEYASFFNPDPAGSYLQTHVLAAFSGNHDFQMGKYYSYHYNQPNLSTLGQTVTNNVPDHNGDYWFTYGNTLFMVLEGNNFYGVSDHSAFMKAATDANPNVKWKVVAFHQAPYSDANHDGANTPDDDIVYMRQNWTKLMDTYHIDVVLNGHDHHYTRSYQMLGGTPVNTNNVQSVTNPQGTVYFTLDSGSGSKYYKFNATAQHFFSAFNWQENKPTYTSVQVTDQAFTLSTYTTDSDTPIDTYTINKAQVPAGGNPSSDVSATPAGTNTTSTTDSSVANPSDTSGNPKTSDWTDIRLFLIPGILLLLASAGYLVFRSRKRI